MIKLGTLSLVQVSLNMIDSRNDENASSPTNPEKREISQLVKCCMQSLGQPLSDYDELNDNKETVSHPI